MIGNMIRSNFYGRLLIGKLHQIEGLALPRLVSDEVAVQQHYKSVTGKTLDLDNPQTFSEKMCWYKIHAHNPLMSRCADKVTARDYVAENGYGETLNELYGVYDWVGDIHLEELPNSFVLKAAHGSHMNVIVKDASELNWRKTRMLLRSWLKQNIYWSGREWVYKDIPHRIIAERYLEDPTGELRDYKFFTFNGVPRMVQVDVGRYAGHHVRNFYDMGWNLLDVSDDVGYDPSVNVEPPLKFEDMVCMARALAEPFQQVRVDLYEVEGAVYFGELTFFHNGGCSKIESDEWERTIGSWWELEE